MLRKTTAVAGIAALIVGLAACGDSSDADPAGDGAPIKVGNISVINSPVTGFPQIETGLKAAIDEINAEGGVEGRKFELVLCNDKYDPNVAITCAQKMVEEEVVAVVGSLSGQAAAFLPILQKAGIPYLGNLGGAGEPEFTGSTSYPLVGGTVAMLGGSGRYVADHGGENVVILRSSGPTADYSAAAMQHGAEAGGATVETVEIADDAADYAPAAASVLKSNPDGVGIAVQGPNVPKAVVALRGQGYDGPIAMTVAYLDPKTVKSMGQDGVGVVGISDVLPPSEADNAFVTKFISALKNEDAELAPDVTSFKAYMGVMSLAQAIKGMDEVTASELVKHLDDFDGTISFDGAIPDWSGIPDPLPYPEYGRLASIVAYPMVVNKEGQLESAGGPYDPFAAD